MDAFAGIETAELRSGTKLRLARMARRGQFDGVFRPGSAGRPPLLVGRREQAGRINALLNEALAPPGAPRSIHAIALHGPRGAGKTVLIDIVKRALTARSAPGLGTVLLQGTDLAGAPPLIEAVLAQVPEGPVRTRAKTAKAGPGFAQVASSSSETSSPSALAQGLLNDAVRRYAQAKGHPPLFIIDEAHAARPEALGVLLNAIQALNGDGAPCAAMLAGTPDLISALRRAGATWFLDRSQDVRLVPVGGISDADCALAVAGPLDALGVRHDKAALADAARWCSGNAYFTQALGAAALAAAERQRDRAADFSANGEVWQRFRRQALRRYELAWQSLDEDGLTGCARQLGSLWRRSQAGPAQAIYSEQVECAVASGLKHPPTHKTPRLSEVDAQARFAHLGLLWSPSASAGGPWELGLPSFFDFVEATYRDPRRVNYAQTLEALVDDEPEFIPDDWGAGRDGGGSGWQSQDSMQVSKLGM